MQQQSRGIMDANADDVFMGNGVSELILFSLRAFAQPRGRGLGAQPRLSPVDRSHPSGRRHGGALPLPPENNWLPDLDKLARLVTPRTRAMVIISPNNPTGAVYPREVLAKMVDIAESRDLVVFLRRDLRPDDLRGRRVHAGGHPGQAHPVRTFSGLSKVYRACGFAWAGSVSQARRTTRANT